MIAKHTFGYLRIKFKHEAVIIKEIVNKVEDMRDVVAKHVKEVQELKAAGKYEQLGPWGRGLDGNERGGRVNRLKAMAKMNEEFAAVADKYINA